MVLHQSFGLSLPASLRQYLVDVFSPAMIMNETINALLRVFNFFEGID